MLLVEPSTRWSWLMLDLIEWWEACDASCGRLSLLEYRESMEASKPSPSKCSMPLNPEKTSSRWFVCLFVNMA